MLHFMQLTPHTHSHKTAATFAKVSSNWVPAQAAATSAERCFSALPHGDVSVTRCASQIARLSDKQGSSKQEAIPQVAAFPSTTAVHASMFGITELSPKGTTAARSAFPSPFLLGGVPKRHPAHVAFAALKASHFACVALAPRQAPFPAATSSWRQAPGWAATAEVAGSVTSIGPNTQEEASLTVGTPESFPASRRGLASAAAPRHPPRGRLRSPSRWNRRQEARGTAAQPRQARAHKAASSSIERPPQAPKTNRRSGRPRCDAKRRRERCSSLAEDGGDLGEGIFEGGPAAGGVDGRFAVGDRLAAGAGRVDEDVRTDVLGGTVDAAIEIGVLAGRAGGDEAGRLVDVGDATGRFVLERNGGAGFRVRDDAAVAEGDECREDVLPGGVLRVAEEEAARAGRLVLRVLIAGRLGAVAEAGGREGGDVGVGAGPLLSGDGDLGRVVGARGRFVVALDGPGRRARLGVPESFFTPVSADMAPLSGPLFEETVVVHAPSEAAPTRVTSDAKPISLLNIENLLNPLAADEVPKAVVSARRDAETENASDAPTTGNGRVDAMRGRRARRDPGAPCPNRTKLQPFLTEPLLVCHTPTGPPTDRGP
ncbi:hypothetical protein OUZ56_033097 [Daphnia magna]|uniref:Uncharacterized protein n=1 Tax=Daphnia magna TaxID=35525 RepID=A0ABR0BA70_9CRUS|nr:hypothetical protein OUZ56_033097 [Daphnia magna]